MWKNAGGSASMCSLNTCERIRPERSRNPIQRLVWGPGGQFDVGRTGIVEDELSRSPRVAIRRLLRLYEGRQYREAASFLLRLPSCTFGAALPDIPVDLIVESLPHSLSLLEAVYIRLLQLSQSSDDSSDFGGSMRNLARVEQQHSFRQDQHQQLLWRVVDHIATSDSIRDARIWSKLLVTISRLSPDSKKLLTSRRRCLDRAVEGLGKHGLVPSNTNIENHGVRNVRSVVIAGSAATASGITTNTTSTETSAIGRNSVVTMATKGIINTSGSNIFHAEPPRTTLVPLTSKLREELEIRLEAYKLALHKIESTRSKGEDRQVRAASHQRQLSLKYSEVQQRLIDNQSLLNILGKPSDRNLEDLIGELMRRVERDKEALRQWNAVRKCSNKRNSASGGCHDGGSTDNSGTSKNRALATGLLEFSRACSVALELMNDGTNDAWTGCEDEKTHRSIGEEKFNGSESSNSVGYHTDESWSPSPEPPSCGLGIGTSHGTLLDSVPSADRSSTCWTTERLADSYIALYAHAHSRTLQALDALEPLVDAVDLKTKILSSVIVLSWRAAQIIQTRRRVEAANALSGIGIRVSESSRIISTDLEGCESVTRLLATSGYESGRRQVAECVLGQLDRTLYDFPCLRESDELKRYVLASSSLAWISLARQRPLLVDAATATVADVEGYCRFDDEMHARHRDSPDPRGTRVLSVLWPALFLRDPEPSRRVSCIRRALVLTDTHGTTSVSRCPDSSFFA